MYSTYLSSFFDAFHALNCKLFDSGDYCRPTSISSTKNSLREIAFAALGNEIVHHCGAGGDNSKMSMTIPSKTVQITFVKIAA